MGVSAGKTDHASGKGQLLETQHVRAEQMGHTIDANEDVYTITSLKRRKEAVNAPEKAIGASWALLDSGPWNGPRN